MYKILITEECICITIDIFTVHGIVLCLFNVWVKAHTLNRLKNNKQSENVTYVQLNSFYLLL